MRLPIAVLLLLAAFANANVKVANVDRTIDLTSQIVKGTSVLTFLNEGTTGKDVSFVLTEKECEHLSHITAQEDGVKDSKLKVTRDQKSPKAGFCSHTIGLPKPLNKGDKIVIKVEYKITQLLTPLPAKITQLESQFVYYEGSAYVPSAYPVTKQKTVFKLPQGSKLQSFTNVAPSAKETERVVYGPYENQEPFVEKPVRVHYENNSPFVIAARVERHIELSHWGGNIAIEEHIELVNTGAKLEGPFSRLDFQMDRRGPKQPALQKYKTILPATARDIYYRDVIGNISTSDVTLRKTSVDVELKPRFPIFGGWKTNYVLGYNLPSQDHLYKKGNQYVLKVKLYDHILDNVVVEHLTTKVVLPETATNVKLATPFSVERRPDENLATYLDTAGRTVVILEARNLVQSHSLPFSLSYEFDSVNMLREPLLASLFFFVLFFTVIIYVRLDFTIISDASKEARDRVQGKVDQLASLINKRNKTYDSVVSAAAQYKDSRDEEVLSVAKAKADKERAEINEKIQSVVSQLKTEDHNAAEKCSDLLKVDKTISEAECVYISAVKKSTQKKGPEDATHQTKIADARSRFDQVLASI